MSSGPYEPNFILRLAYRYLFTRVAVDPTWHANVEVLAKQGVVVYVMRSLSLLDFLCLDALTKRLALPLLRFVSDLGLWILEPFGKGERRLRLRRQVPEEVAIADTVQTGNSALLFLRRSRQRKPGAPDVDLIVALLRAQRSMDKPIFLVPQTFVWSMEPPTRRKSLADRLFGSAESPGKLRVFLQFILHLRNAKLRAGEAFNLRQFIEERSDLEEDHIADQLRYALLRRIERERTLVLGPAQKSPARIREELLRSPRLLHQLEKEARASGRPLSDVVSSARKDLETLCATPSAGVQAWLDSVLRSVFKRMYDAVVVDEPGLSRVREAARSGTLVFLPSHRSHVDYLVLSHVLLAASLSAPLIAAGDNLSFFPVGPLLRRGGAFFIRRSFRGGKLYPALVEEYIRKLIVERFSLEFFVEGGRSRTGKMLPPKLGLLSMVVDAALDLKHRPVIFVPVSIGYERIVEERSYVHELSGGEKKREDMSGVLRAPHILSSRYGRLYIHFGETFRLEDTLPELTDAPRPLAPPFRRRLIARVAGRVVDEINRATVVTPASIAATALLCRDVTLSVAEINAFGSQLLNIARTKLARIAEVFAQGEPSEAIASALQLFEEAGLLRIEGERPRVPAERRLALEYSKNASLHYFALESLYCLCCAHGLKEEVRENVLWLATLLRNDFPIRSTAELQNALVQCEELLCDLGILREESGGWIVKDAGVHAYLKDLLVPYLEAYALSALVVSETTEATPIKTWVKRSLAAGRRAYLSGQITHREALSKDKLEASLFALKELQACTVQSELVCGDGRALDVLRRLNQWVEVGPQAQSD